MTSKTGNRFSSAVRHRAIRLVPAHAHFCRRAAVVSMAFGIGGRGIHRRKPWHGCEAVERYNAMRQHPAMAA